MKQVKYLCDNCEKEVREQCDFYIVKVAIHKNNDLLVIDSKEYCESCVTEVGYTPKDFYRTGHTLDTGFIKLIKQFFKKGR